MVYGELGRIGVYHMQDMVRRLAGDGDNREGLGLACRLLDELPPPCSAKPSKRAVSLPPPRSCSLPLARPLPASAGHDIGTPAQARLNHPESVMRGANVNVGTTLFRALNALNYMRTAYPTPG